MPDRLLLLTATLAGLALLHTLFRLSSHLRRLEQRLEESLAPRPATPTRSGPKPLFSGLYPEPEPTFLSRLHSLPGGTSVLAAGLLIAVTLLLGMTGAPAGAPIVPTADSAVMQLDARVDSLVHSLAALRDSLRQAPPSVTLATTRAPKPAAAGPGSVPPAAILPAPSLPAAPALDSTLVSRVARP